MSKRTFQPSKEKEEISTGFMDRMASTNGRKVLARRRTKGRHKLTVSCEQDTKIMFSQNNISIPLLLLVAAFLKLFIKFDKF